MKKLFFVLIIFSAMIVFTSCTDKEGAERTLKVNNYKPIEVGGYPIFGGGNDRIKTKFRAVAPSGDTVTGCVTRGIFKGSTIRLDN